MIFCSIWFFKKQSYHNYESGSFLKGSLAQLEAQVCQNKYSIWHFVLVLPSFRTMNDLAACAALILDTRCVWFRPEIPFIVPVKIKIDLKTGGHVWRLWLTTQCSKLRHISPCFETLLSTQEGVNCREYQHHDIKADDRTLLPKADRWLSWLMIGHYCQRLIAGWACKQQHLYHNTWKE